ncbi:MAG TPA: GNAT family N-acetyltransferase [Blastococcus sp.]|nr:GNAT family N-acetyltransferase [Blastococcus sp.]
MHPLNNWTSLARRSLRDRDLATQAYRTALQRMRSNDLSYGLKRDLDVPHSPPEALIEIAVRPIRDADVPRILGTADDSLTPQEKWERVRRLRLLESGAGTCYVAVTRDDAPCYVQWLFSHEDNEFIQRYFRRCFPVLSQDTALLEDAFTPAAFRGQRIMSAAMSRIAEQARAMGARYVITFVGTDNTASLKGCRRAGFEIYTERLQQWRMLRPSLDYRPV